ncbi:MAG: hypothetical protein ACFFDW_09765 [Candidatus Thorarchaeota archaeon]
MKKGILILLPIIVILPILVIDNSISEIIIPSSESITPSEAMGNKGIWAYDIEGLYSITIDGNYDDWLHIPNATIGGAIVFLAYDSSNVYIAIMWSDNSFDNSTNAWEKDGMFDSNYATYQLLDGKDDVLCVGFTQEEQTDLAIWTASNRTDNSYLYECDEEGNPDSGNLPFIMNTNQTLTFEHAMPIWDNNSNPLPVDQSGIPLGTKYTAWFDSETTPNDSQNDFEISWEWNQIWDEHYLIEIKRPLITGHGDDISLDFNQPLSFHFGIENKDDCHDMLVNYQDYQISITNEPASLTFNTVSDTITGALLITGTIYDDYEGWELRIELSGWEETYSPGTFDFASVNLETGDWSYLFLYNEYDMPLGPQTITVTFITRYNGTFIEEQDTFFDDTKGPVILGIVDLGERYPDGVPIDVDYVVVTVGLDDDYAKNDDLTVLLYSYRDDQVAIATQMIQFSPGSTTFIANITLLHNSHDICYYTYFIQAWDTNLNKATSMNYHFTSLPTSFSTENPTNPTITTGISFTIGISIVNIILGLITQFVLIIYLMKRKK